MRTRFLRDLEAAAGRNTVWGGSNGCGVGATGGVGGGAVAASRTTAGRRTGPWHGDVCARVFGETQWRLLALVGTIRVCDAFCEHGAAQYLPSRFRRRAFDVANIAT